MGWPGPRAAAKRERSESVELHFGLDTSGFGVGPDVEGGMGEGGTLRA